MKTLDQVKEVAYKLIEEAYRDGQCSDGSVWSDGSDEEYRRALEDTFNQLGVKKEDDGMITLKLTKQQAEHLRDYVNSTYYEAAAKFAGKYMYTEGDTVMANQTLLKVYTMLIRTIGSNMDYMQAEMARLAVYGIK